MTETEAGYVVDENGEVIEEPDTLPDEEPEAAPDEQEEEAPDETPEALRDDVDVDVLETKLETKAKNYMKAMGELIEGTGYPVTLCELCNDAYPAVRWLEPRDQDHAELVALVEGLQRAAPLLDDNDTETCPKCGGWGVVKLPSHVPGNTQRTCNRCNGAGYLAMHPQSGTPIAPQVDTPNGQTEPIPGVPTDDPVIADLHARGYTIVPPLTMIDPGA